MAFITVDAKGENMIVVSPGANRQLLVDDLRPEHFEGVGLILMQLETPLETIEAVAQKAFELNIPVMLNAAPAQPLADDLLQRISYLIVNEGEAALLTGRAIETKEEALEAAKVLQKKGCRNVIVTLGAEGVVWSGAESGQLSAHPVKVIDTTAAGDAFCGALAVKLAEGAPLAKAIAFANAAGALATTKKGAQPSLPLRKDIEAFLKR
jgi:ribokinase